MPAISISPPAPRRSSGSVSAGPEGAGQHDPQVRDDETDRDARHRVSDRECHLTVLHQACGLHREGRERRVRPEEADGEERTHETRRRVTLEDDVRKSPSTNTPERFVQNVAHGNVPGSTGMSSAIP